MSRGLFALLLVAGVAAGLGGTGRADESPARSKSTPRLVTQRGHEGGVGAVAWSPDGTLAVTCGADNDVVLWNVALGWEVDRLRGLARMAESVSFAQDGASVLAASPVVPAAIRWTVPGGEPRTTSFEAEDGSVLDVRIVGAKPLVLVQKEDERDGTPVGWLEVFDLETGTPGPRMPLAILRHASDLGVWSEPDVRIGRIAPDGRSVLGGSPEGRVRRFDAARGTLLWEHRFHGGGVTALAWADGGGLAASAGPDGMVVLFDPADGTLGATLEAHEGPVDGLALSPDGRVAFTTFQGEDGPRRGWIWSTEQAVVLHDFEISSEFTCAATFSPDGTRLLLGTDVGGEVRDVRTAAVVQSLEGRTAAIDAVQFASSGRRMLLREREAGELRLIDCRTGQELDAIGLPFPDFPFQLRSDGRRVLFPADGWLRERQFDRGDLATLFRFPKGLMISAVGYAGSRPWAQGDDFDGRTHVLVSDGTGAARPLAYEHADRLAFSNDGRLLVTASDEETGLRRWDGPTLEARGVLRALDRPALPARSARALALSPDARRAVLLDDLHDAALDEGAVAVRLWDLVSGKETWRKTYPGTTAWHAEYAPDGRSILVVLGPAIHQDLVQLPSNSVWLLDPYSGEVMQRFGGHGAVVESATFTPAGDVVTYGGDGTCRFLDAARGDELCRYVRFRDASWAVVRPDGRFDALDLGRIRGLHWVLADDPFRPVPLEIFMRAYYEPKLLERTLAGVTLPPVPDLGTLNRVQPRVRLAKVEQAGETLRVRVAAESIRQGDRESGVFDLRLFRDDRLVAWRPGRLAVDEVTRKADVIFDDIQVPRAAQKTVELSVYAFNGDRVKSATHRATVPVRVTRAPRDGTAWIVSIGVDAFQTPSWNLSFAAGDARALNEALYTHLAFSEQFDRVERILLVSDAETKDATKTKIREALTGLSVRPEDLVVITWSTHGYGTPDGHFYLLPSDIGEGAAAVDAALLRRAISTDELADWLRPLDAAEMVMIVDACHAAASVEGAGFKPGPMGDRGLGQLAWDKRMRILTASQAADVALESEALRHGLLTYALVVEGLGEERADADPKDSLLYLDEWLRWGGARVPGLADEILEGRRKAVSDRGLTLPSATRPGSRHRLTQQPALFDFARARSRILLR